MAPFGKETSTGVRGRALVVPTGVKSRGYSNFSSRDRVRTSVLVDLLSRSDAGPVQGGQQRVDARLPNWLTIIFFSAGTNDSISDTLPARVEVDVVVETASGRVTAIDVEAAELEYSPYREAAVKEWKETEGVLAPIRNMIALPGAARRATRGLFTAWKDALAEFVSDLKSDPGSPSNPVTMASHTPAEVEQLRRSAVILSYRFQNEPKEHQRARESALQAAPSMVASTRGGVRSIADFEEWLMFQSVSTAITEDEALSFRAAVSAE